MGRKVITFQQYKLSCKRGNLTGNLGQNILTSSDLSTPRLTFLRSKLLCLWALVVFIPQSTNLKRLIKFHQGQVRWLKDIRKEPEISRETRDLFLTTVQVIRKPAETHTHTHTQNRLSTLLLFSIYQNDTMRKFVSDKSCRKLLHRSFQNLTQKLQHHNHQHKAPPSSVSQSRFLSSSSMAPSSSSNPSAPSVTLDNINPKVLIIPFQLGFV